MKQLFLSMYNALMSGQDTVFCSIIKSYGSTPRGIGAAMAVFPDGSISGTVGGGPIEYQSILHALDVLKTHQSGAKDFILTPNQIADIGMICGGNSTVYFRYVPTGDTTTAELFKKNAELYDTRSNAWLAISLSDGAMSLYTHEYGLSSAFPLPVDTVAALAGTRPVMSNEAACYVLPLTRSDTLYLFGGGHVSQELAPVLVHLGFSVVLYEDRVQFSDPALFPGVKDIITAPYTEMLSRIKVTPEDYIVIMTRGHQGDYELLEQALRTPAGYVGVIGSRSKIVATNKRLREAGISDEDIARIHTPIGLPIGAETPAEIAISIAAELIAHRAKHK
ncbi:MAG: XdhC family protein [Clostridia bacterium]|nr:XdhC family protein [Clostridia bacterium]